MDIVHLHDVICNLLIQTGGVHGDEVVPEGKKNADIVFHDHRVVVEVKTLTVDRATTDTHYEKALRIIAEYRRSNGLNPDKFDVLSEELPMRIRTEIAKDYARPFKDHILKANKQIKETKKFTGNSYRGLLILGLPNGFIANPGAAFSFLTQQTERFSAVDCVLMLTIPSDDAPDLPTIVVLCPRKRGIIPVDLLNAFDVHWNTMLETEYGHKYHRVMAGKGAFARDFGLVKK